MGVKLELVQIDDRKTSVEEIKTYITGYVKRKVVGRTDCVQMFQERAK
jgi:hypothetical protein